MSSTEATHTHNAGTAFRAAVEEGFSRGKLDEATLEAIRPLLAEDIVFHSPVTFHPFLGRETVSRLLGLVGETFENFRYVDELAGEKSHELVFKADVDGRELEGIDLLRFDDDGLICDFTVMIRPLSGLLPFAQKMGEKAENAGVETTRA
jgi:hypothetical protein